MRPEGGTESAALCVGGGDGGDGGRNAGGARDRGLRGGRRRARRAGKSADVDFGGSEKACEGTRRRVGEGG